MSVNAMVGKFWQIVGGYGCPLHYNDLEHVRLMPGACFYVVKIISVSEDNLCQFLVISGELIGFILLFQNEFRSVLKEVTMKSSDAL